MIIQTAILNDIKFLFIPDHRMIKRRQSYPTKLLSINMQQIKPISHSHLYMFHLALTYKEIYKVLYEGGK